MPQSSCSLKPPAPAAHLLPQRRRSDTVLPLPSSATLTGSASSASSIRARCQAPGVTVVALVPSAGPVPPPIERGDARPQRLRDLLRADQVHVAVDARRR